MRRVIQAVLGTYAYLGAAMLIFPMSWELITTGRVWLKASPAYALSPWHVALFWSWLLSVVVAGFPAARDTLTWVWLRIWHAFCGAVDGVVWGLRP